MEILSTVKQESPATPLVMISGHGNIETAVNAIKLGAYDFIEKPFKSDRLLLVVPRAIEAARLRSEHETLRLRLGQPSALDRQPVLPGKGISVSVDLVGR